MSDRPRQHPRKHTLRRQPPQWQSGVNEPVLESSAAAKIGTGKLQQWNVDEQRPRRPGSFLYITMISLRASSLVLAFVLAVLGLQLLPSLWEFDRPLLTLMIGPGVVICAFDTVNFMVVCVRRGDKGLPRLVQLLADGLICVFLAGAIAGVKLRILDNRFLYNQSPEVFVTCLAILIILLLIHITTLFCLLLWPHRLWRNEVKPTPRIMYLPDTGEAVVVLARPYPPEPTRRQEQRNPPASCLTEPRPLPSTGGGSTELASPMTPRPRPAAAELRNEALEPRQAEPTHSLYEAGCTQPSLYSMPPRKPVQGSKQAGTHYASPWPPGHVPDEAEIARAARGEAQAHWMTLAGSGLGGGTLKGAEDTARQSEKSDIALRGRALQL